MIEATPRPATIDTEKFRLRRFVETLAVAGELEVHGESVTLAGLSSIIDSSAKATHFHDVGPQHFEMIGAVSGSRRRIALALGVDERNIAHEFMRRANVAQPVVEIASADAPVHQVVITGDNIDLTTLPFHLQHQLDGAPYISAGIDFSADPVTGRTNVGCRRLMLRGKRDLRSNLTDMSDLKRMYLGCLERGEKLPVSFAVGAHPLDFLAATNKQPTEEFGFIGSMRGEPVPMVRGLTNGVLAPADAEMILEGYFDELGYREFEGPYGEFYGFYGPVHIDPVFHVTAVTMRKDAIHQTVLHGGRLIGRADSATFASLHTEVACWRALRVARIEPAAIYAMPSTNGRPGVRVSLKNVEIGQARAVISVLFSLPQVKIVYVVNDDVDVMADDEINWAMATRFRADRDVVIGTGLPSFYADPTKSDDGSQAKVGFDMTHTSEHEAGIESQRAFAFVRDDTTPRCATLEDALSGGPRYFSELMAALGSDDGREIAIALDALRERNAVERRPNGEWALVAASPHV